MQHTSQLPLPFDPVRRFAEAEFCPAPSNATARAMLQHTAAWPQGRLVLWGAAGCGKTHLLHIWAARTGALVQSGASLHGLPALPRASGVALDDADALQDEAALLHLLNGAAEAGLPVLLAARPPPARWPIRLADLASRLRAALAVEIGASEDTLLRALLARLLAARGLRLPESVHDWLLNRLPRTAGALEEAVARLDAAGLDAGRDITIPFAREVLADLVSPASEFSGSGAAPSPDTPPLL